MNLAAGLERHEVAGTPVRVALVGAGKFGTMILAQLRLMRGVRLCALADLDPARARTAAVDAGWAQERFHDATTADGANDVARRGGVALLPSGELAAACDIDILIEATGHEEAGALHALRAIEAGRHVVMVTVEADVVVGPLLARKAAQRGVVYSMAYGDQPAIVCELVDWARTNGFRVVAAGKGTKYLPHYRRGTPDDAFATYGFTSAQIATGGFNPKMFNSFLDGTKSAIEMAAIANATGLRVPDGGLHFAACAAHDLASVLVPREAGGILEGEGYVDVVTCLAEDGSLVNDHLRWGVFVVFTSDEPYARRCFTEYGLATDASGTYAALWRPYHLIGLEIGTSLASIALRGEPTGVPSEPRAEVVCATRRAMRAGETIDGEGGYAVYGTVTGARAARDAGLVPMALANGLRLTRDVPADHAVGMDDVAPPHDSTLWRLRREQDDQFVAGSCHRPMRQMTR